MLTLLEAAKKYGDDPLRAGIIESYAENSDILRALGFDNIAGAGIKYNREGDLPNIGFRAINDDFAEGTGTLDPAEESLMIAGGDLDVDAAIIDLMGEDQLALQTAMKVKALALKFTQAFIKGDKLADQKVFDGLQKRLGDTAGDQVIHAGATSGGDALSLLKLDEAIDSVDDASHLVMNKTMRRRLTVAARTSSVGGNIDYTVDEFGRQVTRYNGLPILIADKDNAGAQILPFTEANPGGGTAASTSIYVVSLREGRLTGLQNGDPRTLNLGRLSTPKYRVNVTWYVNFTIWHKRAATRLRGIKDAAIVA